MKRTIRFGTSSMTVQSEKHDKVDELKAKL